MAVKHNGKEKEIKTNAMRMLDAAKIGYEVYEYEVDENDLSGSHIADSLGLDHRFVFKPWSQRETVPDTSSFAFLWTRKSISKRLPPSAATSRCRWFPSRIFCL